jgi:hypothetical protein
MGVTRETIHPEKRNTMKNYAIKTTKGYLATQGNLYWFESAPVGWALFTEASHATAIAETHPATTGAGGYTIEEILTTPKNETP